MYEKSSELLWYISKSFPAPNLTFILSANVISPANVSTNSIALELLFTINSLLAAPVKFKGVSDNPVNALDPPPPPVSSAITKLLLDAWYLRILPSATPEVFTSVKAFIELVEVTSAPADIPFNFVWSASVNTLLSEAASTAALISALVWSAVALASILSNLLWSASVNTLLSLALSTSDLISAAVWSAVLWNLQQT